MRLTYIDKFEDELNKEAKKLLLEAYKMTFDSIAKDLTNLMGAVRKKSNKYTFEEMQKFKRWQKLQVQIEERINALSKDKFNIIQDSNVQMYLESYNYNSYNAFLTTSIDISFSQLNHRAIIEGIKNPVEKLTLKNITLEQRRVLINKLKLYLQQQLIKGTGYMDMAEIIRNNLGFDYKKALTTVWTENHRVKEKATFDSNTELAKEFKLKVKKQWISTLDMKTRPDHQAMDGTIVNNDEDFKVGSSAGKAPGNLVGPDSAKQNINCRCKIISIFDDSDIPKTRRAGTKETKNIPYKEWKKKK